MTNWISKLKSKVSSNTKSNNSNKIYLTLELGLNEIIIQDLITFHKVYRNDILNEFGYDMFKDSEEKAIELLSKRIIENDMDLIIGDAVWNLSDVLSIEKRINKANKSIDRVYIPSNERRKKSLAKAQEDYKNHSRWINEPPGRLEELYDEFTETLEQLKNGLKKTNIQIVEI